jgi:alkylation response protein AidB-like acyl-CoA dehydrogenase
LTSACGAGVLIAKITGKCRVRLEFSAEDEAFRLEARAWLAANVPSERGPIDGPGARAFVTSWVRRLHQGGWSGISWPVAYGGRGLSPVRQIIWYEEYAAAGAPSPLDASFVSLNHAGPTLLACGSEAQKAFHLPKILSGEVLWCQGFSEPGSGSDLASLTTFGRVEGDALVVNGRKIWSSWADIADYQELLLRTEPGSKGNKGLSWAICDMRLPGITVRPIENLAGTSHFAEVTYDDVRVPLDCVVGGLGHGWQVAMTTLGLERGSAAAALQLTLPRKVEELRHAALAQGEAPGSALMQRLAMARAEALALRALTYETFFRDANNAFEASMVRLFFAEFSQRVHRLAIDVHGRDSLDFELAAPWVEEYLESFSETIAGGTAEIQRNIIGERVLGLPRQARA